MTPKPSKTAITQSELARKLGLSKQRISQLKAAGMPVCSLAEAEQWINARAEETGRGDAAPADLKQARIRKIAPECAILQVRLDREKSGAEYISMAEVVDFIRAFATWSNVAAGLAADQRAERIAAMRDTNDVCRELKDIVGAAWLDGVLAMVAQASDNTKLVETLRGVMKTRLWMLPPDEIDAMVGEAQSSAMAGSHV